MNNRLKEIRKRLKLRQCDVAKSLDICTATYNRYEKGVLNIDATRICQIADVFGVSVDYLLMRTDIPQILSVQETQQTILEANGVHPSSKQEYIDFLIKYTALEAHSRGAIATLLDYEYQRINRHNKTR